MKKVKIFIFSLFLLIFSSNTAPAKEEAVTVYFFWGSGCPHCEKEKTFLNDLKEKYSNISVRDFEVWKDSENRKILEETGKKLNVNISGIPFTVIGDRYFIGWQSRETTGKAMEETIKFFSQIGCQDIISEVVEKCEEKSPGAVKNIKLPLFGEINVKDYSLPVLAIILGAIDGFNPCAMWVLVFLIGLLIGIENKKRRWILGLAFIIASAAVYFIFMSVWLNLLLFLGFIIWVRIAIGIVAVAGGTYNLGKYWKNKEGTCKITAPKKRKLIFEKLREFTRHNSFFIALGGIIMLAFAVNLMELICSAGLPAIFTQVLALSNLSIWQYYGHILLYIFFFMLDDIFVFFAAMITLQATGLTTKYTHLSHLVGGVLMIILGLLLIFKHEWLMLT